MEGPRNTQAQPDATADAEVKSVKPWLAAHRFRKGQSGNPGGQPKGAKAHRRAIEKFARAVITKADCDSIGLSRSFVGKTWAQAAAGVLDVFVRSEKVNTRVQIEIPPKLFQSGR